MTKGEWLDSLPRPTFEEALRGHLRRLARMPWVAKTHGDWLEHRLQTTDYLLWPFEYRCGEAGWNSPVVEWSATASLRAIVSEPLFEELRKHTPVRAERVDRLRNWTTGYYASTRAAWAALLDAMEAS
jgi:hypothetical protein